jgi:hypothetical protein
MRPTIATAQKLRILVGVASDKANVVKKILARFQYEYLFEENVHKLEQVKKKLDEFWKSTIAEANQIVDSPQAELLAQQRFEILTIVIDELCAIVEPIESLLSVDESILEYVKNLYTVRKALDRDLERIRRGEEIEW